MHRAAQEQEGKRGEDERVGKVGGEGGREKRAEWKVRKKKREGIREKGQSAGGVRKKKRVGTERTWVKGGKRKGMGGKK